MIHQGLKLAIILTFKCSYQYTVYITYLKPTVDSSDKREKIDNFHFTFFEPKNLLVEKYQICVLYMLEKNELFIFLRPPRARRHP